MKVLFVSVEAAPFAKVGGLADVVGSLPFALRKLGVEVKIALPAYPMALERPEGNFQQAEDVVVRPNDGWRETVNTHTWVDRGVEWRLFGSDQRFANVHCSEEIYTQQVWDYLLFSEAVLQWCRNSDWMPDVIHCHDWHTGFVPVLMREKYNFAMSAVGSVMTIHNLGYQGDFGEDVLDALHLGHDIYNPEGVEAWGRVNFLKAGCVFADQVNTVSPTYAAEIEVQENGHMLDGLMRKLAAEGRLSGILNGLDQDEWGAAHDERIAEKFSARDLSGKAACKAELMRRVHMEPIANVPMIGMVSRLSRQKGFDVLIDSIPAIAKLPVQLVVLGQGEPPVARALHLAQHKFPDNVRFMDGFYEDLAPHIYAGCDMFAMPSLYEPCGLGQMIAMSYGTIPLVRKTGGLADTVFDGKNGFTYGAQTAANFTRMVERAVDAYHRPGDWKKLMVAGLKCNSAWDGRGEAYVRLYEKAIKARRTSLSVATNGSVKMSGMQPAANAAY